GGVLGPGGALVVEGVRGAVDDGHHQGGVVVEGARAQPQRHAAPPSSGWAGGRSVTGTSCTSRSPPAMNWVSAMSSAWWLWVERAQAAVRIWVAMAPWSSSGCW